MLPCFIFITNIKTKYIYCLAESIWSHILFNAWQNTCKCVYVGLFLVNNYHGNDAIPSVNTSVLFILHVIMFKLLTTG